MTSPNIFSGETRHGLVQIKVHATDAEVEIWRGGLCHASFRCSMSELIAVAGVGATAFNNKIPYMTQEDQQEVNGTRKSFKLGNIVHASRPKDQRLIERIKNSAPVVA